MRFLRRALPEGDEGLNEAVITVDFDELMLLSKTIVSAIENLDSWESYPGAEFYSRTGRTIDEAKVLLSEFQSLLDNPEGLSGKQCV